MSRATRRSGAVTVVGILVVGLLVASTSSCKKHVPQPAPSPEAPPPAPPEEPTLPQETITEAPVEPAEEAPQVEDIDDTIRRQNATHEFLKTLHFDFDQAEIRDDQVPILQANAAWLKAHPQYRVLIEGHADERDTIEYNLALGDRRAKVVRQYLVDLGVQADRMRSISYGEERPVDTGHDEAAWSQNRRAEFILEK